MLITEWMQCLQTACKEAPSKTAAAMRQPGLMDAGGQVKDEKNIRVVAAVHCRTA